MTIILYAICIFVNRTLTSYYTNHAQGYLCGIVCTYRAYMAQVESEVLAW